MNTGVMRRCPLFEGLSDDEIAEALRFYGALEKSYAKGEALIRPGDRVTRFGLVLSGTVQVMMDDLDGLRMIMATVSPGETFGESLCYRAVAESPVYAAASENAVVLWLSADGFRDDTGGHCAHCRRFIQMLTMKTLSMNDRIQVLSKPTLREKLLALFSQYSAREGRTFRLPFDRSDMAAYLGVNRSALSRELSRMKEEGIIDFYKSSFSILNRKP